MACRSSITRKISKASDCFYAYSRYVIISDASTYTRLLNEGLVPADQRMPERSALVYEIRLIQLFDSIFALFSASDDCVIQDRLGNTHLGAR